MFAGGEKSVYRWRDVLAERKPVGTVNVEFRVLHERHSIPFHYRLLPPPTPLRACTPVRLHAWKSFRVTTALPNNNHNNKNNNNNNKMKPFSLCIMQTYPITFMLDRASVIRRVTRTNSRARQAATVQTPLLRCHLVTVWHSCRDVVRMRG